jgi:NUMOD3 motif-containing protein
MELLKVFYTYLWLRDNGTPYYVGKGSGRRGFENSGHKVGCPKDIKFILIQEWPSEEQAYAAEKFLIEYYGRKDLGTGCLRNQTDGGEGGATFTGRKHTPEALEKVRLSQLGNKHFLGRKHSEETKEILRVKQLGNTNALGRKRSLETIEKLREAARNRVYPPEECLRRSLAAKRRSRDSRGSLGRFARRTLGEW